MQLLETMKVNRKAIARAEQPGVGNLRGETTRGRGPSVAVHAGVSSERYSLVEANTMLTAEQGYQQVERLWDATWLSEDVT